MDTPRRLLTDKMIRESVMKIYEYGNSEADIVLLQPVDDHDLEFIKHEADLIAAGCGRSFRLIAVKVEDWNKDLSPWEAPPVFGKESFGSGAPDTLSELIKLCGDKSKTYFIGGYSLAGLFALWASYQTDVFKAVCAASPSVWFPDFTDYMSANEIRTGIVYLSLGDREEKTRNPLMASVGGNIRKAYELLRERGINCVLEWNEGNHFKEPDIRTAKAFIWAVNNYEAGTV